MDTTIFVKFEQQCLKELPNEINKILKQAKGKQHCAIGFITTDDFYGCYLSWDYTKDIEEYYEWKHSSTPSFLYQPLVDIVESCEEINFCEASDEKWEFAQSLLASLKTCIKQLPDAVFQEHNVQRKDVLFFATMGDGDYMDEMLEASLALFNDQKTLDTFGIIQ